MFILLFCKIINDMVVFFKLRVRFYFLVLFLNVFLFVILKFIYNIGGVIIIFFFILDGNNWYTEVVIICIIICLWYFGLN